MAKMNKNSETTRKVGRPRSSAAREAVLDAAYRIVMSEGVGRLTIERVASETGVGKPTIYRTWANAHELAMAAFMAQPEEEFETPKGSVKRRLKAHLGSVIARFSTPRGRQITLTMASAEQESELAKAFRNQIILKSRETGRLLLEQAMAADLLRRNFDVETALDMLYGPLFFRLLAGHQPINAALADSMIETLFEGIGVASE
ncbi:MAG: TetR/AcrR family transcriptional regulator C-terminal ligand-binding domain-containing protein [Pseudomonadales bacterium]